ISVVRGGQYFDFDERFNRYYTDSAYTPVETIYVSPTGSGNGATRSTPASVSAGLAAVEPGIMVYFLRGHYAGCQELGEDQSGTYDDPIILYAEREADGSRGVVMDCCASGRSTCFNLEAADYIAVDGFEFNGGNYGVRAVGADFGASDHQRGIAVLNCEGHNQNNDPFFTGQSDWAVFEGNLGRNAGSGDGHGLYISNGSDWNIVRYNELHSNVSSDFQINADPNFTCDDVNTADCDAWAGSGEGGRGASDYMLVEANFFHHGLAQGANFTSVRRSLVRNNIFALYERHGVSFWQETDNPNLGSSDNTVAHNLFIARNTRQMLQFVVHSTRNTVANNLFAGVTISGSTVSANPNAIWMEVDDTVADNDYSGNYYMAGHFDGRTVEADETARADFDPAWFSRFPTALPSSVEDFRPGSNAPFLDQGTLLAATPFDRDGVARQTPVDIGPFEID
ncbi:MAG: right-handed parallel beta-helix repeat-containing protein, partial [Desulfatitalea sp.]